MNDLSTTIVAVATPPGRGGVGCLRISGPDCLRMVPSLFRPASRDRATEPGGPACFGEFLSRDGGALDHGYVVVFPEGRSFTGELTVELWPHGSPAVLAELVEGAVAAGAEPAGPGEFTYRALCSGRLDLARAEAVRDIVEARTLYQARVAHAQAEGNLSRALAPLRESLEEWIARGEAAVEFVDESETHLPPGELRRAIDHSRGTCAELLAGFRAGRVVRDGATLVMIGLPNVGKSSLFNRLLARDRAIVTATAGTTRDTLEEDLVLDGVPVRLIDTAGLRDVTDEVESEGVRRAERAHAESDLVMLVLDGSRPLEPRERQALDRGQSVDDQGRTVVVVNKCDLPAAPADVVVGVQAPARDSADVGVGAPGFLRVSAVTGEGLDSLKRTLRERLLGRGPLEDPIITNARHARALEEASEALARAAGASASGLSEELLLEDLREARKHIGAITGEFGNEELYDRIFSTFCIGK